MLVQLPLDGQAVRVPTLGDGYRGPLPSATVRDLRGLLTRSLAQLGLSQRQAGQVVDMGRSSVNEAVKATEPEYDDSLSPDEPPMIEPPAPYRRPAKVDVSGRLIRSLKREYIGPDARGRSKRIGQLSDVAEWLASLEPGKVKPRDDPP